MRVQSTTLLSLWLSTLAAGASISPRKDNALDGMWINHNDIKPFQQAPAEGIEGELEMRFKPWLNDGAGCYPYAAVNLEGFHRYVDHNTPPPFEPRLTSILYY